MALLVKYKCEQTIPKHITIKHKYKYQAYEDKDNKSMQDINKSKRQRVSNRKHGRFVSRFEHTCSTSPPSHLKDFHYKPILPDHSVPQHLQGVPTRTLGLSSPFTRSRKNKHTASPLACRGRTSTTSSHQNSKHREPASPPPQNKMSTLVI